MVAERGSVGLRAQTNKGCPRNETKQRGKHRTALEGALPGKVEGGGVLGT